MWWTFSSCGAISQYVTNHLMKLWSPETSQFCFLRREPRGKKINCFSRNACEKFTSEIGLSSFLLVEIFSQSQGKSLENEKVVKLPALYEADVWKQTFCFVHFGLELRKPWMTLQCIHDCLKYKGNVWKPPNIVYKAIKKRFGRDSLLV